MPAITGTGDRAAPALILEAPSWLCHGQVAPALLGTWWEPAHCKAPVLGAGSEECALDTHLDQVLGGQRQVWAHSGPGMASLIFQGPGAVVTMSLWESPTAVGLEPWQLAWSRAVLSGNVGLGYCSERPGPWGQTRLCRPCRGIWGGTWDVPWGTRSEGTQPRAASRRCPHRPGADTSAPVPEPGDGQVHPGNSHAGPGGQKSLQPVTGELLPGAVKNNPV